MIFKQIKINRKRSNLYYLYYNAALNVFFLIIFNRIYREIYVFITDSWEYVTLRNNIPKQF